MASCVARLRGWARRMKRDMSTAGFVLTHARTPTLAKAVTVVAVVYAASPIDLIPDFIPVLGQLDDLIIVPALLACAFALVPADVIAECRGLAAAKGFDRTTLGRVGAAVVVALWAVAALWAWSRVAHALRL